MKRQSKLILLKHFEFNIWIGNPFSFNHAQYVMDILYSPPLIPEIKTY